MNVISLSDVKQPRLEVQGLYNHYEKKIIEIINNHTAGNFIAQMKKDFKRYADMYPEERTQIEKALPYFERRYKRYNAEVLYCTGSC